MTELPLRGLKKRKQVSAALFSFMLGDYEDRRRYEAARKAVMDPEKEEEFINEWQDGHSSLNDIGTYAHALGKKLAERKETTTKKQ